MTMEKLRDGKVMVIATDTGIFVKNAEDLKTQLVFFRYCGKDQITLSAPLRLGEVKVNTWDQPEFRGSDSSSDLDSIYNSSASES